MKIIQVIHGSSEKEIEQEQISLTFRNIEGLLEKHLHSLQQETIKPFLTAITAASVPVLGQVFGLVKQLSATTKQKEHLKEAISAIAEDINNRLKNVEAINLEVAKTQYPRTHNLSIGTYTLHPYDSKRLTRLEHFHKNLAFEKDDELIVLLGKMGAKTLHITESSFREQSASGKAHVSETILTNVEGSANYSHKVGDGVDLLVSFEGNKVEIADDLLEHSLWFSSDSRLTAIFESRRYNPNKIERYTLKNTYTETFDFNFDLAVRYLTVKVDLEAEYNSISKKERTFHIEFGK